MDCSLKLIANRACSDINNSRKAGKLSVKAVGDRWTIYALAFFSRSMNYESIRSVSVSYLSCAIIQGRIQGGHSYGGPRSEFWNAIQKPEQLSNNGCNTTRIFRVVLHPLLDTCLWPINSNGSNIRCVLLFSILQLSHGNPLGSHFISKNFSRTYSDCLRWRSHLHFRSGDSTTQQIYIYKYSS